MKSSRAGRPRTFRSTGARLGFVALAATTALTLAACGGGGSTDEGSGADDFEIAVVADLSGAAATTNGVAAEGVRAAADTINAAGGIDGRQIKLTTYDSKSTPDQAQVAARQAVSDEPDIIAVAALSSGLLASKAVYEQAGIPVLSVAAIDELLSPEPAPWYFTVASAPEQSAAGFVDVLKQELGDLDGKKIAFHGLDSSATNAIFATTEQLLTDEGAEVVTHEKTTGPITSYTSQAQKIVGLDADAVISIDLVENFVIVGQALADAGFTGPYLNPDAASTDDVFERLASPNFFGGRVYMPAQPDSVLAAAGEALGGDTDYSGNFFPYGWVMTYLAAEAAANCDAECGPEQMTAALEGITDFTPPGDVAFGPLSFAADRHNAVSALQYFVWDDATQAVVKLGDPIDVK